ncbi:MAG: helix-turn-helix domain-containing protein [bacterium]|nr:helix-turn-helix domain-containing protein [bacterium]
MKKRTINIESAEDFMPEIVFDRIKESEAANNPVIRCSSDNDQWFSINGKKLTFGPTSGTILRILIRSSVDKRPLTLLEIKKTLWLSGSFLKEAAIINAVSRIRKKIRREFEGRIDPYKLIETKKSYGYIINAQIAKTEL